MPHRVYRCNIPCYLFADGLYRVAAFSAGGEPASQKQQRLHMVNQQANWSPHEPVCLGSTRGQKLNDVKPSVATRDVCAACGKTSDTLKHCSRCMSVSYCSRSCQHAHWFRHKTICLGSTKDKKLEDLEPTVATRNVCAACGKTSGTLKPCSRCVNVSYCSKSCQQAHWSKHKPSCQSQLSRGKPEISSQDVDIRNQPVMVEPKCSSCGKVSESLRCCTRCKKMSYCSRSCQKSDWPTHKNICHDSEEKSETDHTVVNACVCCGSTSDTLKRCTRCMKVSYCDRKCQQADWSKHKLVCGGQSSIDASK